MGAKERIIVCITIRIIKKIGLLSALEKIAKKTENEEDDLAVKMLIEGINLVDQVICQKIPIEEVKVE